MVSDCYQVRIAMPPPVIMKRRPGKGQRRGGTAESRQVLMSVVG